MSMESTMEQNWTSPTYGDAALPAEGATTISERRLATTSRSVNPMGEKKDIGRKSRVYQKRAGKGSESKASGNRLGIKEREKARNQRAGKGSESGRMLRSNLLVEGACLILWCSFPAELLLHLPTG